MSRVVLAALVLAFATLFGSAHADAQTTLRGYTLSCTPISKPSRGHVLLNCSLRIGSPIHTPRAFDDWHYGDPMPRAILAQVVGGGAPAVCDGATIVCQNGVVALNASGAFANNAILCTNASGQITTTGCPSSGGGDTITSPGSTLTVGGTSSATTLDIALGHANYWTAVQGFVGAGGSNACAGTQFPTHLYGLCAGANNGTTNNIAMVVGPQATDFNCTSACPADNSARIAFFNSLSSGANEACDVYVNNSFSGKPLYLGCIVRIGADFYSTTHDIKGGAACSGTGTFTGQASSGGSNCLVTLSSGSAAWTFSSAWSHAPLCIGTDQTALNPVKITTTTATATITGTGSDVIAVYCFGNGQV